MIGDVLPSKTPSAAATLAVLVVGSVVLPAVGASAGLATAAGFVSLSADVGTQQPIAGEQFQVTATLSNAEDSNGPYEVRRVVVRDGTGSDAEVLAKETGTLATVRPGETASQSLGVTINETGNHELELTVTLESPGGITRTITQDVEVGVYEPHPQLAVSASPATDGEWRTLSLTVSNGLTQSIRQVAVEVAGERIALREERKVTARVASGGATTFEFPAKVEENGRREVTATLSYTTADGDRRTVTRTLSAEFAEPAEPSEHPQVSVETETAVGGAWRSLNVTVANGLAKRVRQVSVAVDGEAVEFKTSRRVVAGVPGGSTTTFRFPARAEAGRHEVTVTLRYLTDSGIRRKVERTVTADFTPPSNPGRIDLTGVSVQRTPRGVEISGSASNLGSGNVQSVIVEVVDAENVRPAQPSPEYFVGTVDASDFEPFDLNARLSNNRTTVPIRVTYQVDGVERSFVTEVRAGGSPAPRPQAGGGGGGFPVLGLLVVVVLLGGVLGVGFLGYRFVRG